MNHENEIREKVLEIYPNAEGIVLYGSRIGGYARPDSDYDVLVIVPKYPYGLRYHYVDYNKTKLALLVTSERLIVSDASVGLLGEFVAGRLLAPIKIIYDKGKTKNIVTIYRYRVILEGVNELAKLGVMNNDLKIPIEYFPIRKMKIRAKLYTPLKYSYSKLLKVEGIRERLRREYKPIIDKLVSEGILEYIDENHVKLSIIRKINVTDKVLDVASLLIKGIASYIAHAYAGLPEIYHITFEITSKVKRRKYEVAEELKHPEALLKLREGIIVKGREWLQDLIKYVYGQEYHAKIVRESRKGIYTSTTYEVASNNKKYLIVVKEYASLMAFKWFIAEVLGGTAISFYLDPLERLCREYHYTLTLRNIRSDVDTPKILGVHLSKKILIREYIRGDSLLPGIMMKKEEVKVEPQEFYRIGEILAIIHNKGYAIGDCKPDNFLLAEDSNKVYLVDLEQARDTENENELAWDIAEFTYFTFFKLYNNPQLAEKLIDSFIEGYISYGPKDIVKRACRREVQIPFIPGFILNPPLLEKARKILEEKIEKA